MSLKSIQRLFIDEYCLNRARAVWCLSTHNFYTSTHILDNINCGFLYEIRLLTYEAAKAIT